MSLPSPPAFGGALRLASPANILRIGIVAACDFRYSPVFLWERPHHQKYPSDTLLSYRTEFANVIKDPSYVVLVAVDKYDPNEGRKSEAIIPPDNGWVAPSAGEDVVVAPYPTLPENQDRDKSLDHSNRRREKVGMAKDKYFKGHFMVGMVVVHPAYWRLGHGSALVKWGLDLTVIDELKQGVVAARMGTKLYKKFGYSHLEDVSLEGDDLVPDGVEVALLEYDPKGQPGQGNENGEL